jgi:branched-chain amino acid transport system substrate-binding protein
MFKTNVVYVGVNINEITNIDFNKETAKMDMSIWFRYSGNSEPQDIKIDNIVEPIILDSPVESQEVEDVMYRRYHIRQTFKLNFTQAKRAYGQHIVGVSFRHNKLNRNNLMYVVDLMECQVIKVCWIISIDLRLLILKQAFTLKVYGERKTL